MQSSENTALSVYLRFIANGQPIQVDIASPGAKEAYERGKALTARQARSAQFRLPRLPSIRRAAA